MGREAIRADVAAYYGAAEPADGVDVAQSRYTLHETGDPDVLIVEIDTVLTRGGQRATVSLVQIFRVRDSLIAELRDYSARHEDCRQERNGSWYVSIWSASVPRCR